MFFVPNGRGIVPQAQHPTCSLYATSNYYQTPYIAFPSYQNTWSTPTPPSVPPHRGVGDTDRHPQCDVHQAVASQSHSLGRKCAIDYETLTFALGGGYDEDVDLIGESAEKINQALSERTDKIMESDYESMPLGKMQAQILKSLESSWVTSTPLAANLSQILSALLKKIELAATTLSRGTVEARECRSLVSNDHQYHLDRLEIGLQYSSNLAACCSLLWAIERWCRIRSTLGMLTDSPRSQPPVAAIGRNKRQTPTIGEFVDSLEISKNWTLPGPVQYCASQLFLELKSVVIQYINRWLFFMESAFAICANLPLHFLWSVVAADHLPGTQPSIPKPCQEGQRRNRERYGLLHGKIKQAFMEAVKEAEFYVWRSTRRRPIRSGESLSEQSDDYSPGNEDSWNEHLRDGVAQRELLDIGVRYPFLIALSEGMDAVCELCTIYSTDLRDPEPLNHAENALAQLWYWSHECQEHSLSRNPKPWANTMSRRRFEEQRRGTAFDLNRFHFSDIYSYIGLSPVRESLKLCLDGSAKLSSHVVEICCALLRSFGAYILDELFPDSSVQVVTMLKATHPVSQHHPFIDQQTVLSAVVILGSLCPAVMLSEAVLISMLWGALGTAAVRASAAGRITTNAPNNMNETQLIQILSSNLPHDLQDRVTRQLALQAGLLDEETKLRVLTQTPVRRPERSKVAILNTPEAKVNRLGLTGDSALLSHFKARSVAGPRSMTTVEEGRRGSMSQTELDFERRQNSFAQSGSYTSFDGITQGDQFLDYDNRQEEVHVAGCRDQLIQSCDDVLYATICSLQCFQGCHLLPKYRYFFLELASLSNCKSIIPLLGGVTTAR